MFMAKSTWPQVRAYFQSNDTVVIGVGSLECHGRHNPLGTDTMAPDALVGLVDAEDPGFLIAPTLPYGATDDLVGFPGTVSLGVDGLTNVLTAITDQLYDYGARRFVFVNGHGGNMKPLYTVCIALNRRGCLGVVVNWWKVAPQINPAWGGGHGDGMETSANLAIDPSTVDLSCLAPEGLRDDLGEGFRSCGWCSVDFEGVSVDVPRPLVRVASNGWVAEGHDVPPQNATAGLGRAMLEGTAHYIVRLLRALRESPLPEPLADRAALERGLDILDAYNSSLVQ